jgi:hypothetical protein
MRVQRLPALLAGVLLFVFVPYLHAESPRGFFIEDLRRTPPVPAFYNLDTRQIEPLKLKTTYVDFLDIAWDHDHGRVFFSARTHRQDVFKIYMKDWPDGEEKVIYENPTGPFRFLISPDGDRIALQIMGPLAWPIMGVYDWPRQKWTPLGQGYSPDWSVDGKRLLYLKIPSALPTWLYEYSVETDSATPLINEPVMEAVYTDDPRQIIVKTAGQSKRCDVFQVWHRESDQFNVFSLEDPSLCKKRNVSQRQLTALPGHRFFFFKESIGNHDLENQSLIVTDVWGGHLQSIAYDDWSPQAMGVEEMSLAMSEDPVFLISADGTGGKIEIPQARFPRVRR